MKIGKKLGVSLSIIALVLGILIVVPIALIPSATKSQSTTELQSVAEPYIMIPEDFHAIYGTNTTNAPKYIVVRPTETCYLLGEDGSTGMPVEELYLVYGANATIPIRWFVWPDEPGEFLPASEPGE